MPKHINSTMSQYWAKKPIIVDTPFGKGVSVVFTWQMKEAEKLAKKNGLTLIGGPAAKTLGISFPEFEQPIIHQHNPYATFTTRGCPKKCEFCVVPRIEGDFKELDTWKPAPIICDNNILACSKDHFIKVIDSVILFWEKHPGLEIAGKRDWVDFNQGLDHKLITDFHLEQIKRIKNPIVRYSFDHRSYELGIIEAVERTKKAGIRDVRSYVLIGFDDTPQDALHRLTLCRDKLKIVTSPMRYQPIDAKTKNSYVNPNWTEEELKKMMRYFQVGKKTIKIPYEEFDNTKTGRGKGQEYKKEKIKMEEIKEKKEKKVRKLRKFSKKQDTLFDFSKYQVSRELLEKFCERVSETRKKLEEEILLKLSEVDLKFI